VKKEEYVEPKVDPERGNYEIYTSMQQLEEFFMQEMEYVEDLRTLYDKKLISSDARGGIGGYIQSFEDVLGDQEEDREFVHNPLNVYNLMRHVAVGWSIVENALNQDVQSKNGNVGKRVKKVLKRREDKHVPDSPDVDGVAVGIARLHDFYRFNTSTFVNEGVLEWQGHHYESTGDLTVWDAFKIGVKGTNAMFLGTGIDMMDKALEKAVVEGVSSPAFIEELDVRVLRNLIKTSKTVHDQKLDRWGERTDFHSTNSKPYSKILLKKKKFHKVKEEVIKLNDPTIKLPQEKWQFMELCRGRDLRPIAVTSQLYCKYEHNNQKAYLIGPQRIEVVSLLPYIVVAHNFIHDVELKDMIKATVPLLRRSEMVGKPDENGTIGNANDVRVSEQGWLQDNSSWAFAKYTQRLQSFFNINADSNDDPRVTNAEHYQVANYGISGQYGAHYDQVLMMGGVSLRQVYNRVAGDRVSTVMGYLSDVPAGGLTVWPYIGAYVTPQKGSVALWWHMDKAGGYDLLGKHGGCPVMIGSKWIINKWIRSNGQMFRRPCPKYSNREVRGFREDKVQTRQKGGWFQEP